jgi:hypothetical protein
MDSVPLSRPSEAKVSKATSAGLLMLLLLISASCGNSAPPPSAVQSPSPAANPRIVYEMREKCGRDAREWFQHFYGNDPEPVGGFAFNNDFKNHYNERLNRCYAVLERTGMGMVAQRPG